MFITEETILQIDAIFRFGDYHRIELGYFELERNGTTTLPTVVNVVMSNLLRALSSTADSIRVFFG